VFQTSRSRARVLVKVPRANWGSALFQNPEEAFQTEARHEERQRESGGAGDSEFGYGEQIVHGALD